MRPVTEESVLSFIKGIKRPRDNAVSTRQILQHFSDQDDAVHATLDRLIDQEKVRACSHQMGRRRHNAAVYWQTR